MESLIVQQIEREVDLLTASPTERLARVLKRSPNLFQEVPLKYIASYLRMTPETLSRIRNS
jgi:CRP/FNR family transcriptional regulator, anaerobic regulatory protein